MRLLVSIESPDMSSLSRMIAEVRFYRAVGMMKAGPPAVIPAAGNDSD
jgi:hypothetical protein